MITKIEKLGENFLDDLEEQAKLAIYHIAGQVSAMSPVATGSLQTSWTSSNLFINTEKKDDSGITIAFGSPLWGKPKGYGAYVEFGTRPHWPPLHAILDWVHIKGLVQGLSKGKKRFTEIGIAKAIQYKIAARGTRAQHYFSNALERLGLRYGVMINETDIFYEIDIMPMINYMDLLK